MTPETGETLPNEVALALAYSAPNMRDALRIFFELDARLSRIVAATSEPMLGQMRLAWWRDTLRTPVDGRPNGDAVLDAIGEYWAGYEEDLVALVDAWELMLQEELNSRDAYLFAIGRARPADALMRMVGEVGGSEDQLGWGMVSWALADAAVNISNAAERDILLEYAKGEAQNPARFPRALRGLSVLVALSRRSIKRGGRPLMEGRGAALTAIRAAIFAR